MLEDTHDFLIRQLGTFIRQYKFYAFRVGATVDDALRPTGETAHEFLFLGIAGPAAFQNLDAAEHAFTMMDE